MNEMNFTLLPLRRDWLVAILRDLALGYFLVAAIVVPFAVLAYALFQAGLLCAPVA